MSNKTLKPSVDSLGAAASHTSRRAMKKPDTGSEMSVLSTRRHSQVAKRLPRWRVALRPVDRPSGSR